MSFRRKEESLCRDKKLVTVIPTNGGISIFDRERFFTTLCSVLNDMVKSVIPTKGGISIFDRKRFFTTLCSVLNDMVKSVIPTNEIGRASCRDRAEK